MSGTRIVRILGDFSGREPGALICDEAGGAVCFIEGVWAERSQGASRHQPAPRAAQSFLEPDGGGYAEFNRRSGFRLAQSFPMLSVTITIADLFEFEGKLPASGAA